MKTNNIKRVYEKSWLFIASFSLLIAKAFQYLFFADQSPRIFIYPEYVGVVLMIVSICLLRNQFVKSLSVLASLFLVIDAGSSFVNSGYEIQNLLEHSLMLMTLVVFAFHKEIKNLEFFLKLLTALTFIGHGVYAIGLTGVPLHFIEMTTSILPLSHSEAIQFLWVMGVLDILASILIFSKKKFLFYSLIYMIIWGFLTALARPIYSFGLNSGFGVIGFFQRIPHFIVPLLLLRTYLSNSDIHSSSLE